MQDEPMSAYRAPGGPISGTCSTAATRPGTP